MPGVSTVIFGAKHLDREEIQGKRVIDVGSYDFNGSIRPLVESWQPSEYIGVDLIPGPSVDIVCNADDLVAKFGKESFDVVICLEMLEHSQHYKRSISNLKNICKPQGTILITTRSYGYPCHGFPNDFWRFEARDMEYIFSDCKILSLEKDYQAPGIFIKVQKPVDFVEENLVHYELYSLVTNRHTTKLEEQDFHSNYFKRLGLKQKLRSLAYESILGSGRVVSQLLKI